MLPYLRMLKVRRPIVPLYLVLPYLFLATGTLFLGGMRGII